MAHMDTNISQSLFIRPPAALQCLLVETIIQHPGNGQDHEPENCFGGHAQDAQASGKGRLRVWGTGCRADVVRC